MDAQQVSETAAMVIAEAHTPELAVVANEFAMPVLDTQDVSAWYGAKRVLDHVSFGIAPNNITAIIGPSGCGKSTLIRCYNRMNDFVPGFRLSGKIMYRGDDLYGAHIDPIEVRVRIGMVFQRPNPFPKSIYENIAYGPRILGVNRRSELDGLVEDCLRKASLWDEVKDSLRKSALELSGGQQQRLCIARALANEPEVLLLDEPCSAIDPVGTSRIEELLHVLKSKYTIVIVTHNMQQAARVSDYTAFLYEGILIEFGPTLQLFERPANKRTEDYITGRFG
jgi:phosphate transport system ATP-binding protein